jgi:hypothetical protein
MVDRQQNCVRARLIDARAGIEGFLNGLAEIGGDDFECNAIAQRGCDQERLDEIHRGIAHQSETKRGERRCRPALAQTLQCLCDRHRMVDREKLIGDAAQLQAPIGRRLLLQCAQARPQIRGRARQPGQVGHRGRRGHVFKRSARVSREVARRW